MKKSITLLITLLFVATLLTSNSHALSTDRDQPAEIEADDIEFDFRSGKRTYIDNVYAEQGTLRIKADKLIANYKDGELVDAKAWGSLATFKQRPDGKPDDVQGWAKTIIVDYKTNVLRLVGKAALKQGADTARGEMIIYNMETDRLRVKGGAKIGNKPKPAAKPKPATAPKPSQPDAGTDAAQKADEVQKPSEELQLEPPKEEAPSLTPTPSGRSRLIIQPK
jgi:lipopolysaccharide export system protein LptA